MYQVEIVPAELIPVIMVVQFTSSIVITFFTLPTIELIGLFPLFSFFTLVSFFSWFFIEGYCVETRGKTKLEIKNEFINKTIFN